MLQLEHQLQFLYAQESSERGSEEQQDSVATVRELLLQLVQETGRLGPLLAASEAESEGS
jgi:hypothetical protein